MSRMPGMGLALRTTSEVKDDWSLGAGQPVDDWLPQSFMQASIKLGRCAKPQHTPIGQRYMPPVGLERHFIRLVIESRPSSEGKTIRALYQVGSGHCTLTTAYGASWSTYHFRVTNKAKHPAHRLIPTLPFQASCARPRYNSTWSTSIFHTQWIHCIA